MQYAGHSPRAAYFFSSGPLRDLPPAPIGIAVIVGMPFGAIRNR